MRSIVLLAAVLCLPPSLLAQRRQSGACVLEGYSTVRLVPSPETANPVVVILGSSTAAGVGASRPSASWAAELEQRLGERGIRVANQSVPGSSTGESLERFERDVVPYQPAFVLLTTALVNENFLADAAAALERYLTNTAALIDRVRQIGAVPALMTMYPHNRYTPAQIELIGRWTRAAELTGWPVLNFMSPVSDSWGRWLRGLSADGVHPVDPGHRQMVEAIPDSLLAALLREQRDVSQSQNQASWRAPEEGETPNPLRIRFERPVSSWTVAAYFRDPALTEEIDYFEALGEQPIRLARRMDKIELWAGSERVWRRTAPAVGWRHFALSYQALTGRILVAVDGAAWGEAVVPENAMFRAISVAGSCRGCNVAHLLAYRANLHPLELSALAGTEVFRRSLDLRVELNTEPSQWGGVNLAQTLSSLEVEGAWMLDNERFPPPCAPAQEPGDSRGGGN